ncbi:succinoglycan biosynthesis transport protein ExoP [Oxalobacteraceae bacterium GrIS 1.18]
MNLISFLLVVRSRYKVFLITFCVVVFSTVIINLLLPKTYKATSTLVLNFKGVDPVTGMNLPAQMMPGYMPTQVDIATSLNVAMKVVDDLKLADAEETKAKYQKETKGEVPIRTWLGSLLLKNLEAVPSRESSVLDISYKAGDPQFAATIANGFATAYRMTSIQLKVTPAKEAASYINDQVKMLRDNLEIAQSKLSKFQQERGIVSSDNRVDGLDVENNRLNELSAQLVAAQGQLIEASSRQNQASGIDGSESPDVMNNSLVMNLKASLSAAEAKFAEVADRLDVNHPQYQSAKAEVDKLRADLNTQIRIATHSVGGSEKIYIQRESELKAAVAAQKSKVLQLNRVRDDLKLLRNEVDSAQRAYDTTSQRYTQTNLEGQSNQTDIAVLNPATPPVLPFGPKVMLNTLLAIFFGTFLGMALAITAEMRDRRIRTVEDVALATEFPVLGVMDWTVVTRPGKKFPKWHFPWRKPPTVLGRAL